MDGHDCVPGHKAAMRSHQHSRSVERNVLESFGFNAPIMIGQEAEETFGAPGYEVAVDAEAVLGSFGRKLPRHAAFADANASLR